MKLTKIIVQILFLFQYNYCHKLSMVFGRAPAGRAIAASPPSLRYVGLSATIPHAIPVTVYHSFLIIQHPFASHPFFEMSYIGTCS